MVLTERSLNGQQPPLNPREGQLSHYLGELERFAGQVRLIYVQPGMQVIAPVGEQELQQIRQGRVPFSAAERSIIGAINNAPSLTLEQLSGTLRQDLSFAEYLYALQERLLRTSSLHDLSQEHAVALRNGFTVVNRFLADRHPPKLARLAVGAEVVEFLVHPGSFDKKGEVKRLKSGALRFSRPERLISAYWATRRKSRREDIVDLLGISFNTLLAVAPSLGRRLRASGRTGFYDKLFPPTIKGAPK